MVQGRGMSKEEVKLLGQDIRFIKLGSPRLRSVREPFLFSAAYWVLFFGILILFAMVYVALRRQIRESQNVALLRGKRANKVAVQRFRAAKRYMEEQNRHAFYEEMLRALWGYMSDKFNIPVANLTKENVREEPAQTWRFVRGVAAFHGHHHQVRRGAVFAGRIGPDDRGLWRGRRYHFADRSDDKTIGTAMKKRISVCLVLLLGWLASYAQEPADSLAQPAAEQSESAPRPTTDELWDMANTAYINGNFHSAAEVYEEILSRGVSSVKLYYNLANAYFKEDRIGKAILYYKRALRLAPGNDDIRHNLSVAEARTKDNIEDIPEFFFVTWMREARHTMSLYGVERPFAGAAGLCAGAVSGLPAGPAAFAAQGRVLRHRRRRAVVHADDVVRAGRTPRDARRHFGRGHDRFYGGQEFARQVVHRPFRAARRHGRDDHEPARRLVRSGDRRRQEGVAGVPQNRNDLNV